MTRDLRSFLATPELTRLARMVSEQQQLDQQWQQILPQALLHETQVLRLDHDCLWVSAKSNAVATKLRNLEVRLLTRLRANGLQINAIRWKLQVGQSTPAIQKMKQHRQLSEKALLTLEQGAATLQDESLKQSILRMVKRHRQG